MSYLGVGALLTLMARATKAMGDCEALKKDHMNTYHDFLFKIPTWKSDRNDT